MELFQGGVGERCFGLERFPGGEQSSSREGWKNVVLDWNFSWEGLLNCNFGVELFQGEVDNFVSDWNFSWEWLLKCNFRVELFQGGVGKRCFRLNLFLRGVAKMQF